MLRGDVPAAGGGRAARRGAGAAAALHPVAGGARQPLAAPHLEDPGTITLAQLSQLVHIDLFLLVFYCNFYWYS